MKNTHLQKFLIFRLKTVYNFTSSKVSPLCILHRQCYHTAHVVIYHIFFTLLLNYLCYVEPPVSLEGSPTTAKGEKMLANFSKQKSHDCNILAENCMDEFRGW